MNYDEMLHCIVHGFAKGIRWHDFSEFGLNAPDFEFYYAESRLYVIRNNRFGYYSFIRANNPLEALKVVLDAGLISYTAEGS